MPISDKLRTKDLLIAGAVLVFFAIAFFVVLNIYKREGEKRSAVISDSGERDPDHIEVFVKLMSVDPIKGDATARLEFIPHARSSKARATCWRAISISTSTVRRGNGNSIFRRVNG